jgi:DUF2075 family protein
VPVSAFRHSAAGLAALALEGTLAVRLAEQVRMSAGQAVSGAEIRSWERSLPVLAQDLLDAGLHEVEVLLEYRLPLSSRRVDAILAGQDAKTGDDAFVVVEHKQWSSATRFEDDDQLVLVDGVRGGPRLHPGLQVKGYCETLVDFLGALDGHSGAVRGAAYLHNAHERDVHDLYAVRQDEHSRVFTGSRRSDFVDYLRAELAPTRGAPAADRLLASAVRPSRQLLSVAAAELRDREQFVLLDEQRLAYELVLHAVERARAADSKQVVVVTGGPGSGKSVIALSLLGELSRQGRTALHATGSKSFTSTMRRYAGTGSTRLKGLFQYFNSFVQAEQNGLDVLICDEAHRIRATSANRWTRATDRTGKPQVMELIDAARVPVFLLDEHQVVKPGEIGTVATIEGAARSRGLPVHHVALHDQFRCGGSAAYERWVARLLGLEPGGPEPWLGDDRFEIAVASSPFEMEALLLSKEKVGYRARMSAGYCWPWSNPRADGTLVPDVQVDDWARPWNVKSDRKIGEAPGSPYWATDAGGFGQVGCIYTAQGFEYDWSGVIVGPDLVIRDGVAQTVRSANVDPAFRGSAADSATFDAHVRHIYKVLLTRGMIGTVIYAVDHGTREFLHQLVDVGVGVPGPPVRQSG